MVQNVERLLERGEKIELLVRHPLRHGRFRLESVFRFQITPCPQPGRPRREPHGAERAVPQELHQFEAQDVRQLGS